jgi:hypothetical protein
MTSGLIETDRKPASHQPGRYPFGTEGTRQENEKTN